MKLINLSFALIVQFLFLIQPAWGKVELDHHTPSLPSEIAGSSTWISVTGIIERGDAQRLEQFIKLNGIAAYSTVFFNSPGGNLFEGMEIGRVIRKYGLNTDIAILNSNRPAYCYSACSLAYIGGIWRYKSRDNQFGIHRFYSLNPTKEAEQLAQAASGQIIRYLNEMGVPAELFVQMSRTPSTDMLILSDRQLTKLGVVNNGILPTTWDIRTNSGLFYVIGERFTEWGIQKTIFICDPSSRQLHLMAIFDTQGRNRELLNMASIELSINNDSRRFDLSGSLDGPISFTNGLANVSFSISRQHWAAIQASTAIGLYFQRSNSDPWFLGFDGMPTGNAKQAFNALSSSCY